MRYEQTASAFSSLHPVILERKKIKGRKEKNIGGLDFFYTSSTEECVVKRHENKKKNEEKIDI